MRELSLPNQEPDFEAEIEFLTMLQVGRKTPAFNGIRWDFAYEKDDINEVGLHMIHPYFIDDNNELISNRIPLNGKLRAWIFIVFDERRSYHKGRISVGQKFNCHEGSKSVAKGVVTKLIRLREKK